MSKKLLKSTYFSPKVHILLHESTHLFPKKYMFTCQKTPQMYMTYYTDVHDLLRKSTYLLPKKYIVLNKDPLFLSTFRLLNKINKKKNDVYVNLTQLIHVDAIKLDNQICFPLYACAKEIVRRYKPFLDELDLTYTQYIAMMVLWEGKEINVKDLGKKCISIREH